MGTGFSKHAKAPTPQSAPIRSREAEMVKNEAGGFGFKLSNMQAVRRFLILGTEGGTYYANERDHTLQACDALEAAIKEDGPGVVGLIHQVSTAGLAPKNDYALFALAVCFAKGDAETKKTAATLFPEIARIGTHLFHFAEFVNGMRGWGRSLKDAVAKWYQNKEPQELAFQLLKYPSRDGWSHRDLLRLSHPKPATKEVERLYAETVGKGAGVPDLAERITTQPLTEALTWYYVARKAMQGGFDDIKDVLTAIKVYQLPRECLNTKYLTDPEVWKVLLPQMGMTALVRNLGVMTANETLKPLKPEVKAICEKLRSANEVKMSKIHPLQVLMALLTYSAGRGQRSDKSWEPIQPIVAALEDCYNLAFGNVKPTGKRIMLTLDISGSMHSGEVAGCIGLTPAMAACAMASVFLRVEEQVIVTGFGSSIHELAFNKNMSLKDMVAQVRSMNFGGTDAALPMQYAKNEGLDVDAFICFTDGESWAGSEHPSEALARYRKSRGNHVEGKQVCVGLTATGNSIGDTKDPRVLEMVGFDASAPQLIQEFIAGSL